MKRKILSAVFAIALTFAFTGCIDPTKEIGNIPNPSGPTIKTLDQKINDGSLIVDLTDEQITLSAEIRNSITLKNADFGGNSLTVKKSGVHLVNVTNCNLIIDESVGNGEVFVDNCDFNKVFVNGGGANSIHFKNTKIVVITVQKENVRVVLEEKTEITKELEVHSSGIKIETEIKTNETSEVPKIKTLTVSSNVTAITLSGGSIQEVKVEQNEEDNSTPIITIASADTEIETVVVIDSEENIKEEEVVAVVIVEEIKEEFKAPEGIKEIKVEEISFDYDKVKKEYFQYNEFNGAGVIADVKYSNGKVASFEVSKDDVILSNDSKDFTLEAGKHEISLSVTYLGKTEEKKISVNVYAVANKVEEAFDELLKNKPNYDRAIQLFKEAYEQNPSNESALYYALSLVGSISVDDDVRDLLKNYLGFTNYPATMNALIGGEWLENYYKTYEGYIYEMRECAIDNEDSYVRCDVVSQTKEFSEDKVYRVVKSEGKEICIYDYNANAYEFRLNEEGDYYVLNNGKPRFVDEEDTDITEKLKAAKKYKIENINIESGNYIIDDEYSRLPGLISPDWVKNTERYKNSVFNGVYSTSYFNVALLAAIIESNPNGLNAMMDKVSAIFDNKFDEARFVVERMNNNPVKLPSTLVDALNLTMIFGNDDGDVYVGKAEANVLFSLIELIQGVFDYASATDLSLNLKTYKEDISLFEESNNRNQNFYDSYHEYKEDYTKFYESLKDSAEKRFNDLYMRKNKLNNGLNFKNCFGGRNSSKMKKSKDAFVHAFDTIIESYDFLVGENSYYPEVMIEMLQAYGSGPKTIITALKNSIKDGTNFAVPMALMSGEGMELLMTCDSWSFPDDEVMFNINFGALFTPGAFKGILTNDSGNFVYSYKISYSKGMTVSNEEVVEEIYVNGYHVGIYNEKDVKAIFNKYMNDMIEFEMQKDKLPNNCNTYYYSGHSSPEVIVNTCLNARVFNNILPGYIDFVESTLPEGSSAVENGMFLTAIMY